jgi:hypothetical protein
MISPSGSLNELISGVNYKSVHDFSEKDEIDNKVIGAVFYTCIMKAELAVPIASTVPDIFT